MKTYSLDRVENNVSKGEIARVEQFLLLSKRFQKSSAAEALESVYMWERVKLKRFFIIPSSNHVDEGVRDKQVVQCMHNLFYDVH